VKTSVRDLPVIAAKKQDGATTVASTMTIAAWAGVDIFVTGGIGGVHREASETFDISADLPTLGRVRVGVVCAGAKSILDVPATLEYLETQSVPVLGYKTDVFPGFYIRNTGLPVLARVDTPEEAAAVLQAKKDMDLPGSVLYTVPIPAEFEVPEAVHEKALELILREAKEQGIRGKDVTPFILARFREETGGEALAANLALVKNNAQVGADIAVALKRLQK
jgi:pseudouridine-5'-phosphate glycosidase